MKKKKFRAKNGFGKCIIKNVVITYKSRIFKFKIQKKCFTKKMRNDMIPIFFIFTKENILTEKIAKNLKILDSLRKLRKSFVFCILKTLEMIICCYKENLEHLNVSFRILFNTFCFILNFKI